jgi:hypothetical protein
MITFIVSSGWERGQPLSLPVASPGAAVLSMGVKHVLLLNSVAKCLISGTRTWKSVEI